MTVGDRYPFSGLPTEEELIAGAHGLWHEQTDPHVENGRLAAKVVAAIAARAAIETAAWADTELQGIEQDDAGWCG